MGDKIKVLVIDDAAFMRRAVTEILETDSQLAVVGTAKNGLEGLKKIKALKPDVVTLDMDMPVMDGLSSIRHIMIESPVPIVVLSSLFNDGAVTFDALRLGVVDFLPKPSGAVSDDIKTASRLIVDRVKMAKSLNIENIRRVRIEKQAQKPGLSEQYGYRPLEYLITLGTTISGPNTVIRILSQLPPDLLASIVVVQEISPKILPAFVEKFNKMVPWQIEMARDGMGIVQGSCYIGSNSFALSVDMNEKEEPILRMSSRIDDPLNLLFSTSAEAFKQNTIGVLLTGTGVDGSEGFRTIRNASGVTIAQNASSCVYPNLIDNAINKGTVDVVLDEKRILEAIISIVK
jgi:two-component system chemotaxis response regulator CheB